MSDVIRLFGNEASFLVYTSHEERIGNEGHVDRKIISLCIFYHYHAYNGMNLNFSYLVT